MGIIASGCKQEEKKDPHNNVRVDIRWGSKFCSLLIAESGDAYAIKGTEVRQDSLLAVISSDTSKSFKLDSVKVFFENLDAIRINPVIMDDRSSDSPTAQIYFNDIKIYNARRWDSRFWDVFRPIMEQIPEKFNPFLLNNGVWGISDKRP